MKKHWLLSIIVASAFILLSVLWYFSVHEGPITTITLRGPDGETVVVHSEIADEAAERQLGLMERKRVRAGHGMLFVFDQEDMLMFWMKNTLVPLDILFFDEEGIFVSRRSMEPCREEKCPAYSSIGKAAFALEVNRSEPLTKGVGEGWILEYSR
jgi:uncharacterized protein